MNASPKKEELSPSALWLALTALPRPSREIPLPRMGANGEPVGSVLIWPLTQEEQMASNADADRFTKQLLKDPQRKDEANLGYDHTFTNEMAVQVLFRACRDVTDIKRPAFPSPLAMRSTFTTDEIGVLFNSYCTVQAEVGPIRADLSTEECEALILRLEEGGSAFPFDSCSYQAQRTLVLTMASRLVSCWTRISWLGSQPDVSPFVLEHLKERERLQAGEAETTADASGPETTQASEDVAPVES